MRSIQIPTATRREIGTFIKKLRPVQRRYADLVAFLGAHRQRAHELLQRVGKLDEPAPPAKGKGEASPLRTAQ